MIQTEHLVLRPLTPDDAPRIAELAGDWDVARMTGRVPWPYPPEAAFQWIEMSGDDFIRGITLDDVLIGCAGYVSRNPETAELGYWIGKPYWGRGLTSEAVAALIDRIFADPARTKIVARHFADNPASGRVLEKLRFRLTGMDKVWSEARKLDVTALAYKLARDQWQAATA